ncbi:hypothetical protein OENI_50133 [Oenococcus oeni]|nr:hypothetical protein OENI_50133 [Oenococcus oeni]
MVITFIFKIIKIYNFDFLHSLLPNLGTLEQDSNASKILLMFLNIVKSVIFVVTS